MGCALRVQVGFTLVKLCYQTQCMIVLGDVGFSLTIQHLKAKTDIFDMCISFLFQKYAFRIPMHKVSNMTHQTASICISQILTCSSLDLCIVVIPSSVSLSQFCSTASDLITVSSICLYLFSTLSVRSSR